MVRRVRGPVCVIGADIPGINRQRIATAFASLGQNDAVFGPAPDGGYWLIGVKSGSKLGKSALNGVRWSTEHTLSDSRTALGFERVAFVDALADVDTADDLP